MTPHPVNLQHSRKDIESLISQQTQAPCLLEGCSPETVLAFLMQLYAYVFAKFGDDIHKMDKSIDTTRRGTGDLKDHLMTSGRYQVVIYTTDFRARPNALRLRQRPAIYNGASLGSWIILWPGAERDTYFKTGRVISAIDMDIAKAHAPTCRGDEGEADTHHMYRPQSGRHDAASILRNSYRPLRLIPP